MKYSIAAADDAPNANFIVKLKKMYQIMCKIGDRNLYRAFLNMRNYGSDIFFSRTPSELVR